MMTENEVHHFLRANLSADDCAVAETLYRRVDHGDLEHLDSAPFNDFYAFLIARLSWEQMVQFWPPYVRTHERKLWE